MERKTILGILVIAMIAVLGISMVAARGFGGFGFAQSLTDEEKAEMQEQHEAMQTAVSEGDYTTWKSLMGERIAKMQSRVTEDNFNVVREQHQKMSELRTAMQEARESGDFSKVEELQEEYGSEGRGFGKGMKAGYKIGMKNCPSA